MKTVKDVCDLYQVTPNTVLGWIHNGELKAVNVGRRMGANKPRWRISDAAITAFESLRTPSAPTPKAITRRAGRDQVIEFYR